MVFARTLSGCLIPLLAAAIEIAVATHAATAQQPEPTQMATAQPGITQAAQALADAIAAHPEGGQALVDAIAAIVAANPAIAVEVIAVAKSAPTPVVDALAAGLAAAQASLAYEPRRSGGDLGPGRKVERRVPDRLRQRRRHHRERHRRSRHRRDRIGGDLRR